MNKIKNIEEHQYLHKCYSNQGFNGTIVNPTYQSLNEVKKRPQNKQSE